MLILTRTVNQTFTLSFAAMSDQQLLALRAAPIEVTLSRVGPDSARIGVTAPRSVQIERDDRGSRGKQPRMNTDEEEF